MLTDLTIALDQAIQAARAAREAQAAKDAHAEQAAKPVRTFPPKNQGDVAFTAHAYTLRVCTVCDHAIHVGTPVVTHWPVAESRVSHPYHPNCWETRP